MYFYMYIIILLTCSNNIIINPLTNYNKRGPNVFFSNIFISLLGMAYPLKMTSEVEIFWTV